MTTTESNIDRHKQMIDWQGLPKSFQDAITVVSNLEIQYIWIDSLCIIQGSDSDDWLQEAPKMADYYQSAFLTISAALGAEAMFKKQHDNPQIGVRIDPPEKKSKSPYHVYIRKPLSHQGTQLHTRGWVFQEHLLSIRVVHFSDEIVWECAERTECECGRFPLPTKEGTAAHPDVGDIGDLISTYGRKFGHLRSLARNVTALGRPDEWIVTSERVWASSSAPSGRRMAYTRAVDIPEDGPVLLQRGTVIQRPTTEVRQQDPGGTTTSAGYVWKLSREEPEAPHGREIRLSPLQSRWLDIVAQYTRRNLTFEADVFPALAGFVKQTQALRNCAYYAGLWEDTLIIDLLWRSRTPEKRSHPMEWLAPTWCWASAIAPVDYYHLLASLNTATLIHSYTISGTFVDEIDMQHDSKIEGDTSMGPESAAITLTGNLVSRKYGELPMRGSKVDPEWSEEQAEELRDVVESALHIPTIVKPPEDINYAPMSRGMERYEMAVWLTHHTRMDIIMEKDPELEDDGEDVFWPDCRLSLSDDEEVQCLLVARHSSGMGEYFLSIVLKPIGVENTYMRLGLLKHNELIDVEHVLSTVTIV